MKNTLKLTTAAVLLLVANVAIAQQTTDLCDRVKSAGKEAANKKISEYIKEARKTYRLYKDLRKECQDFINNIPIAEISQMGTVTPAVSPGVTAAIKVAVEEYVMPRVQAKIREVCKDANDAYKNKVEDFEDKVIPPPVAKTGREAERRVIDWEKEIEKSQKESEMPSKQTASNMRTMSTFSFEGKQESLLAQVMTSPEFKSYAQINPFEQQLQVNTQKKVEASNRTRNQSPITSAYERSISQPSVSTPAPTLPPVQPTSPVAPKALPSNQQATTALPSNRQGNTTSGNSGQERGSFFKDMFGGK